MVRRILGLLCVTALSGCGTLPFELVEREAKIDVAPTSLGTSIPPSMSMAALPPAAGSVVSVIERQRGNALQHEVTLHGAPPNYGENQIVVTAFRNVQSVPEKPIDDALPMNRPTEPDIAAEMEANLPGGALPISSNAPRNGAGPFAYAFGRKGNVSCLYAWQWVENGSRLSNPPVSVRVRLCKPATTEEVLVDYVRQLYLMPRNQPNGGAIPLVANGGVRPYGDALSAARGPGATYAYHPHPYGMLYAAAPQPSYPKADAVAAAPRPVQRVVVKKVIVRQIVRRRVVAPQIYSSAPIAPPAAVVAPATPRAGGYSAVPMPQ